jgi:hypothetical protein
MGEAIPHRSTPGRLPALPFSRLAAAGLMLLFAATGCGKPEMGRVSGRITNGGKPVAGATVIFYTPNRPAARAVTDADGRYTLSTRRLNDGAYAGRHKVALDLMFNPGAGGAAEAGAIAPDVRDLEKTPLEAEVKAGTSNTCDLDIASAKGSGTK